MDPRWVPRNNVRGSQRNNMWVPPKEYVGPTGIVRGSHWIERGSHVNSTWVPRGATSHGVGRWTNDVRKKVRKKKKYAA